jgi:hypothetical protein
MAIKISPVVLLRKREIAMNTRSTIFVASTIVAGICLVGYCFGLQVEVSTTASYLLAVMLALLASTLKVRLPGITGTISINFLFVLVSTALFTFAETVLLAALAGLVQCLWRAKSWPRLVQISFNVATLAISSGAAYRLSHFIAGSPAPHLVALLTIAASFYFTANTMMISGVLSLVQDKSLFTVWQQCYLWSFPYYLAGAVIAGFVVEADRSSGWLMSLLVLLPMCLIYAFYRIFVKRFERRTLGATAQFYPVSEGHLPKPCLYGL